MIRSICRVLLVQLSIPPAGPEPIRGNVPLAAAYLTMYARYRGLGASYDIHILPPSIANTLGDQALVEAILADDPWMVGFTCYLWNIERTLWIAARLKERRPDLRIVIGGPEVTADNSWVLHQPAVDFAVIGEGEQTFADLLQALQTESIPSRPIDGLYVRGRSLMAPNFRQPLPRLDEISSPYLEGILDAADEQMLLLETIRGCIFKCKFCYYPKSYDDLYFVSQEKIVANLEHARRRGAREVVLLDPTLNQRKDFPGFLRLLAENNPDHQFTYFGELRGEGINAEVARLLKEANFTEVEIGLQSVDPHAQTLMDRKTNMKAFERGAKAMLDQGIRVKVDLIIGLPGDTMETVREGIRYLKGAGLYSDVQVFNLAILPGTAFRQEAEQLGLIHQPRPPYYVLKTPTLRLEDMFELMQEAQEVFEAEFDALPAPKLDFEENDSLARLATVELDSATASNLVETLPPAASRSQAFTLWLRSDDFSQSLDKVDRLIARTLEDNPFSTLQVMLEPTGDRNGDPGGLTGEILERLLGFCQQSPTYLDKFYAVQPGSALGAKRLVVVLPLARRASLAAQWIAEVGEYATIAWRGPGEEATTFEEFETHEYIVI